MQRTILGSLLSAAILCCNFAAPARATLFVYEQTSASVPGLSIDTSITVNGGLSDLPTLTQSSTPIGFGNLLAFDLQAPDGVTYTLANFVAPSGFGFPLWSISPQGISFNNSASDFAIFFAAGTIQFETDAPSNPRDCGITGRCVTTGHWAAIAEPAGAGLILVGLSALGLWRRRTIAPGLS